ncbi:MAG: thioredoxin family protein [Cocleimonas sp.]
MSKENHTKDESFTPDALMLLSSHCAHCPGVLELLSKMIKAGDIANLTVVNLEKNPDAMQKYKVRSVPWVRIGKHELTGSQTLEALQQRAQWAIDDHQNKDQKNLDADFDFLLSDGQVNKVIEAIKKDQLGIKVIMSLLGDSGTVLSTRIGIGVVFEEFATTDFVKELIPQLAELSQHEDQRIRADAYHYLGLTKDKSALPFLEKGKNDKDLEVREIVADSLEELNLGSSVGS